MNAQEIIDYIANSEKKTPVKLYVNTAGPVDFGTAKVFGSGNSFVVFGDWGESNPSWRPMPMRSWTMRWRTTGAIPACPCWT